MRAALLARGDFLSVFPPDLVAQYNWLKVLPLDLGLRPRPIAIVTLKNRTLSSVAELFMSQLRAAAQAMVIPAQQS
jgi:DNA-binding transcriptional LysR family regulator